MELHAQIAVNRALIALGASLTIAQEPTPPAAPSSSADQSSEKPVSPQILTHKSEAEFPDKARIAKLNGKCFVTVTIDTSGMPQDVHFFRCTDPIFAHSSVDAIARYRFRPAVSAYGKPVPVTAKIEVTYQLSGGHGSTIMISYSRYSPPGVTSFSQIPMESPHTQELSIRPN